MMDLSFPLADSVRKGEIHCVLSELNPPLLSANLIKAVIGSVRDSTAAHRVNAPSASSGRLAMIGYWSIEVTKFQKVST